MDINFLAYNQYNGYIIYKELAQSESSPEFKKILQTLARHESNHFRFWKQFATTAHFSISPFKRWLYRMARKMFGLTFTVRFLERHEKELINQYQHFLHEVKDAKLKKQVQTIIQQEQQNERLLISHIKEEKVEFISSIVLGLSDGLIEITGALVGFTLAFRVNSVVALTGSITGLAAALSMASSAYMQARYEQEKNARKAAIYTGITYIAVVGLLLLPFLITTTIPAALTILGIIILFIVSWTSYYTSILFERSFRRQFLEMMIFTVGVAGITFLIGLLLRHYFGVAVE